MCPYRSIPLPVPTGETWTDQRAHVRQQVRGEERVVFPVMGVWPTGRRMILDDHVAAAEDTESWQQLFAALCQRGLDTPSKLF